MLNYTALVISVNWQSIDPPHTFLYTGRMSSAGERINRFALSLKNPAQRAAFLGDQAAYFAQYALTDGEADLVRRRDWSGLLEAGGHLQAILKIAATVGESLWDIGAHCARMSVESMKAACPRRVGGLPRGSG
jgi:protocatechuate 4,5-dioxygenase, alpha chain